MKSKFKKVLKSILPLFMVIALSLSGSVALLAASTQKITNTFEGMYTGVELIEPSWDPSADNVYFANETFAKDPQVYNSGNKEAYVYLSVFVPYVSSGVYDFKGVYDAAPNRIAAFKYSKNDSWQYLYSDYYDYSTTITYKGQEIEGYIEFYAYYKPIASGETTEPLFNAMTFINYDVDEEYRLEEEEALGNGNGSDIIGEELPVIIQPYAVTTDVNEKMKEFADSKIAEGEYWNYGPMMAWTYLVEQLEPEYADEIVQPKFLSLSDLGVGTIKVRLYSCEGETIAEIKVKTRSFDRLNYEAFNSILTHFSALEENKEKTIPLFDSEEEFLNAVRGNYILEKGFVDVIPGDSVTINCTLKDIRASVNVSFYANGELQTTGIIYFNEGDSITNEILQQRILDEYGYNVEFADQEINETAVKGAEYYINVNIVDSGETT